MLSLNSGFGDKNRYSYRDQVCKLDQMQILVLILLSLRCKIKFFKLIKIIKIM